MSVELASAYISLVPSAKGIREKLTQELGGPEATAAAGSAGEAASSSFASKFSGMGGKLAGVFGAAAGVLGGGAIVGGLLKIGSDFDEVSNKIRIQTGATGQALDGLTGSFKKVFADVPASSADAGAAIGTLNQKLGLTGKPLEDLSAQVLNLSRITHTDLNTNLDAASSLFNNWGISAEQQGPKLDELFRISQATGISVADLATKMADGGAVLRQVGLTYEQSAALVGTLGKAGLDASEVMPALSKSLATSAKEGKSAHQVFTDTFNAIKNAPNDTVAAGDAMQVFGAKAGPKLAALVREGKLSYEELAKSVAGGGDTINKAADDTARFPEKIKLFMHKAELAVEPLASKLFELVGILLDKVAPVFQTVSSFLADKVVPAVKGVADQVVPLISHFAELAASKVGPIVAEIAEWIQRLADRLRQVDWGAVFEKAKGFIEPVATALESVGTAVFDLVKSLATLIQDHWPQIKSAFDTIVPILGRVAEVLRTGIADAMKVLGGVIKFVSQNVNDFLPGLAILVGAFVTYKAVMGTIQIVQKAFAIAQAAVNAVMSANPIGLVVIALAALVTGFVMAYNHIKWFHDAVDAVARVVKAFVTGAIDFLVNHWKLMLAILTGPLGIAIALVIGHFQQIKDAITGAASWVGDKIGEVVGFFTGLPGRILSALGDFASLLLSKGVDLIQGFVNGYLSLVGTVTSFFTGIAGQVLGWIGDAASWLVTKGWDTITGLLVGLGNAEWQVINWVTGLAGRVLSWIGDAASWLVTKGWDAVVGLFTGLGNAEWQVINWFTGLAGRVIGWIGDATKMLVSVGEDIVRGLRDGIVSGWHWVTDKVSELVGKIPGPIKSLLGIGSPSRVFAEIGRNVTDGLAVGLDAGIPSIADRMNGLAGMMAATPLGLNADLTLSGGGGAGGGGLGNRPITQNFYGNTSARDAAGELAWTLKTAGR